MTRVALIIAFVAAIAFHGALDALGAEKAFDPGRADYTLTLNDVAERYNVRMVALLPGRTLRIAARRKWRRLRLGIGAEGGRLTRGPARSWVWHAPDEPGLYHLDVKTLPEGQTVQVKAFVLVPASLAKFGVLNGFSVGEYPRGADAPYPRPRGFIEMTEGNENTLVSPHFTLKQFRCKQDDLYPTYLLLSEKLLFKLERVLARLNEKGVKQDTLFVMSGYRTPHYNTLLKNVTLSQHQYGAAADVFPDGHPRAGQMADLNGDGKVDFQDARLFASWVDELEHEKPKLFPAGGIGVYDATSFHGPFVHIDARGKRARWGGE